MKNEKKMRFLLVLTLLIIKSAGGQSNTHFEDNYTKFYSYTTNQGLSCSDVLDVIQDKYGFIWVASKNGLNKFNGQTFTQYFKIENNLNSLPDNIVTCLSEDIYGTIWIGTENGLCRYNRRQNYFEEITGKIDFKDKNIRALYADKTGILWIETLKGGLYSLDISSGKLLNYQHPALNFEGDYFYHFIYEDSKQRIWIGGRNFSPRFIKRGQKDFLPKESFAGNDGSAIFEDKNHIVWISGNYGVNFYNEKTNELDDSVKFSFPFRIQSVLNEGNGNMWFGGDGSHVFLYHQQDGKWTRFAHDEKNPNSLISTKINKIYKDNQGNIWFATSDGLSVKPAEINKFRHYRNIQSAPSSLSSNKISAILQDKKGIVWVGSTDNGIDTFRFENELFGNLKYEILNKNIDRKIFLKERDVLKKYFQAGIIGKSAKSPPNLIFNDYENFRNGWLKFRLTSENHVNTLYEDAEGTIFIGLWNGIGFNKFNYETGFKREFLFGTIGSNLFSNEIAGANWFNDFLEDKRRNFWIATWEGIGLNLYNREKGEFEGVSFSGEKYSYNQPFFNMVFSGDSLIWLNNSHCYLGYFNIKTGKYSAFVSDSFLKEEKYSDIRKYLAHTGLTVAHIPKVEFNVKCLTDDQQNIWAVTDASAISKYAPTTGVFTNYWQNDKKDFVKSAIYVKGEKKIYFNTISGNIFCFSVVNYKTEKLPRLAASGKIDCSIAEYGGKLWVGIGDSLFVYNSLKKRFDFMTGLINSSRNLMKIDLMKGNDDFLFIASANKILAYSENNKKVVDFSAYVAEYPSIQYFTALEPDSKILWAGSDLGLFKMNITTGEVTVFQYNQFNSNSIPSDEITALELVNNELFVATRKGLCSINRETYEVTLLNQIPTDFLSTRLLTRLKEDNSGNIWIGTSEKGVNLMNPNTKTFKHFFEITGDTTSISGNYVECIFQDSDNNIWVGTDKALNLFIPYNSSFQRYTQFGKQNPGNVKAIQEDKLKNLWISTVNGLFRLNPKTDELIHFTNAHGIQDNSFSNASTRLLDGRLAFGGLNGITVFNPDSIKPDSFFPQLFVENLRINDSVYIVDCSEIDSLNLKYFQNKIAFSIGTSAFFSPETIKFKYRLKGLETSWNFETVKNNEVKYNNLQPGTYQLEIETTNSYGVWNANAKICTITVARPWWQTWWFFTLLFLLIISAIIFIIRVREHNLKLAKNMLEVKVIERTKELADSIEQLKKSETALSEAVAAKDKFFSIIAHDLKNPVLALKFISDKLVMEFEKLTSQQQAELLTSMNKQINVTYSFLDNLLLWSLSQKNAVSFNPQVINLSKVIAEVVDLLAENASLKGIQIVHQNDDNTLVFADKNMVFTVLINLLNNAIKFSFYGKKVVLSTADIDDFVKVCIEDEGVGIRKENILELFKITSKFRTSGTAKEPGTGLGLLICKEFVEKNGGFIAVESFENKGSIFYFTLPKADQK